MLQNRGNKTGKGKNKNEMWNVKEVAGNQKQMCRNDGVSIHPPTSIKSNFSLGYFSNFEIALLYLDEEHNREFYHIWKILKRTINCYYSQ